VAIETTYNVLYAGMTAASVKLPTQPAAEISIGGGARPALGPVEFDLGVTYFLYPGEAPAAESNGINYWEAATRPDQGQRDGLDCRWFCLFAERVQHGSVERLCRGRAGF
jgi:hypothetical protein